MTVADNVGPSFSSAEAEPTIDSANGQLRKRVNRPCVTLRSMCADDRPKSAFEIAMERLRQQDADSGVVEHPPTEDQKAAIAEARSLHASKVAELEILHRSRVTRVLDPADRAQAEDDYRRELQRVNDDCERKVRKIRESQG